MVALHSHGPRYCTKGLLSSIASCCCTQVSCLLSLNSVQVTTDNFEASTHVDSDTDDGKSTSSSQTATQASLPMFVCQFIFLIWASAVLRLICFWYFTACFVITTVRNHLHHIMPCKTGCHHGSPICKRSAMESIYSAA